MKNDIAKLMAKHVAGKLTDQEFDQLEQWVCASEMNMQCFLHATYKPHRNNILKRLGIFKGKKAKRWSDDMQKGWHKIKTAINNSSDPFLSPSIKKPRS